MATASSDSRSRTPSATVCGRQFFEDFLAHRVVDFGQRGEIEVDAQQFDQPRAQFRLERLDQVAEVGFVQVADQRAQRFFVARLDRAGDLFNEFGPDGAVISANGRVLATPGSVFVLFRACRSSREDR